MPEEVIPVIFFICTAFTIVLFPLARALARRMDRQERMPPEVTARLERMEQALDSIAIEVERISEGQRFTTKLLAEKSNVER
jgi:hypothetical protein